MRYLVVVAILVLGRMLWGAIERRWFSGQRPGTDTESMQKSDLLVILRLASKSLQPAEVEATAQAAWGQTFGRNPDETDFLDRCVPGVMSVIQAHGNAFLIAGLKREDRKLDSPTVFLPPSASALWEEFTHDLSVGLMHAYDSDPKRLQLFLTRLVAELCDDQSIAIYHPKSRTLWELTPAILELLRDKPGAFFECA